MLDLDVHGARSEEFQPGVLDLDNMQGETERRGKAIKGDHLGFLSLSPSSSHPFSLLRTVQGSMYCLECSFPYSPLLTATHGSVHFFLFFLYLSNFITF